MVDCDTLGVHRVAALIRLNAVIASRLFVVHQVKDTAVVGLILRQIDLWTESRRVEIVE